MGPLSNNHKVFQMRLVEHDLLQGAKLINPLTTYIQNARKFDMYLCPTVPAMLLAAPSNLQEMMAGSPAGKWKAAWLGQLGKDTKEAKKLCWQKQGAMPTQLEIKQEI